MEDAKTDALNSHLENINEQAGRIANQEDHELTAIQALKKNPKTVIWCAYAIWLLVLNSFENQAGGTALGIPEFR